MIGFLSLRGSGADEAIQSGLPRSRWSLAMTGALSLLLVATSANAAAPESIKNGCKRQVSATAKMVSGSVYRGNEDAVCDCVLGNLRAEIGEDRLPWLDGQLKAYYRGGASASHEAKGAYMHALSVCSEQVIGRDALEVEATKINGPYRAR